MHAKHFAVILLALNICQYFALYLMRRARRRAYEADAQQYRKAAQQWSAAQLRATRGR